MGGGEFDGGCVVGRRMDVLSVLDEDEGEDHCGREGEEGGKGKRLQWWKDGEGEVL